MSFTAGRKVQRSALSRIGDTYGSLTILDIVGKNSCGHAICSAKCVCGNEKEYKLSNLVDGSTQSCGCYSASKHQSSAKFHIGKTINKMTLLEIVGKDKWGNTKGRFACGHCDSEDKEFVVSAWSKERISHCGCKKRKKATNPIDHIGVQYGYMTLIKITGKDRYGSATGLYYCSNCGNEKDGIKISNVTSGSTRSCGCLENKAGDFLGSIWNNLKLIKVMKKSSKLYKINNTTGIFQCLLCGSLKELNVANVKSGRQRDCGCSKLHGYTNHKSFMVYKGMINRCTNPLTKNYPQYGGRGVSVCDRWLEPNGEGLKNFMEDIGDARPDKKHSLHRMWKYNEEERLVEMMEYGPDTCKWATSRQQNIEKTEPKYRSRVEHILSMADEGKTVDEMANILKTSASKVEFYLARCGLIKDYTYTEDGKVIKKTKRST